MVGNGTKTNYNQIAAILFAIMAIVGLFGVFNSFRFITHVLGSPIPFIFSLLALILYVIACAKIALSLYNGKRDNSLLQGFILLSVYSILNPILNGMIYGDYFSGSFVLPELFYCAAVIGVTIMTYIEFTDRFVQYKDQIKGIWFIPAILGGIHLVLSLLPFSFMNLIGNLIFIAALLFASIWIVYSDGLPESAIPESTGDGYRSIIKMMLLSVFTLGIYYFIWIYQTSRYLNRVTSQPPQRPGHQVAACIFLCFFGYLHYWTYKNAQRIDTLAHEKGIQSNISFMCLLFAPFFISGLIMQDRINTIVQIEAGEIAAPAASMVAAAPVAVAYTPAAPVMATANNPDELPEL